MSSRGTSVSAGVPVGGLAPGSYEAKAAIERVRLIMNPETHKRADPVWSKPCKAEPKPKATNVEREWPQRTCKDCPADITNTPPTQIRCGPCREVEKRRVGLAAYHRKMSGQKTVPRTDLRCVYCGTALPPTVHQRRYCSSECSNKQQYLDRKMKALPPRG